MGQLFLSEDIFTMSALEIVLGALILVASIIIIAVILLQEGRRAGISGVISGGTDTFLSKNKAKTFEAFLAKWTKVVAIVFFLLVIAANFFALK